MTTNDLHWLAGFLEGEGSFVGPPPSSPRRPRVIAVTTDEDVARRAHRLMGGTIGRRERAPENHKAIYEVCVSGRPALKLMELLAPLMGARRQERIAHVMGITPPIGENYGRDIKLTLEQHEEIADRYLAGGVSQQALADEYGVSQPLVGYIVRKRRLGASRARGNCTPARAGGRRYQQP